MQHMNGAKKEHATWTSQGLGSPRHRRRLDLIAVIGERCAMNGNTIVRRAETEHA